MVWLLNSPKVSEVHRVILTCDLLPSKPQQRYEYTKLQRNNSASALSDAGTPTNVENPAGMPNQTFEPPVAASQETANNAQGKGPSSRPTNPRLTEDRLRRLEEIGFQWKVKHKMKRYYDKQWDSMFERLKAFKEQNGHVMVPKRYPVDIKLGTWVRFSYEIDLPL